MHFTIHDVGHGFCAHLLHENGNVILWDCGHKSEPDHRPSNFLPALGIQTVHRLIMSMRPVNPTYRYREDVDLLTKSSH